MSHTPIVCPVNCLTNRRRVLEFLAFSGELHHAVSLSQPKIIFASQLVSPKVERVAGRYEFVKKLIVLANESKPEIVKSDSVEAYNDLVNSVNVRAIDAMLTN